jgi:hypothetical protein
VLGESGIFLLRSKRHATFKVAGPMDSADEWPDAKLTCRALKYSELEGCLAHYRIFELYAIAASKRGDAFRI